MPSFKPVIALTRGLEILRVVNQERHATIKAIHAQTRLDKATIVRMLETLEHEGYIMRDPDQAVYSPTGRTLVLSQGYDHHLWIGRIAEPIMNSFRTRIGWPSDVAIFDRDAGIINGLIERLGGNIVLWLEDPMAFYALIVMILWGVGGGMIIYLAGLQGVPPELREAAAIDGAGRVRAFLAVDLPLLTPVMYGSISGLRSSACISVPASASAAPTVAAIAMRGKRNCHTIVAASDGTFGCSIAANRSGGAIVVPPTASANSAASGTRSARSHARSRCPTLACTTEPSA